MLKYFKIDNLRYLLKDEGFFKDIIFIMCTLVVYIIYSGKFKSFFY